MRTENVIVLGERGRLPHVTLLACTVFEDRIEARAYIVHAPLRRGRTLARMGQTAGRWQVLRGALFARVPRLDQGVSLHGGLSVPITRKGK